MRGKAGKIRTSDYFGGGGGTAHWERSQAHQGNRPSLYILSTRTSRVRVHVGGKFWEVAPGTSCRRDALNDTSSGKRQQEQFPPGGRDRCGGASLASEWPQERACRPPHTDEVKNRIQTVPYSRRSVNVRATPRKEKPTA